MALPQGGRVPWPPQSEAGAYLRYGEWSAWYSGSAAELERFYAGYAGQDRTGFFDPKTTAQPYTSIWRRFAFWARQDPQAIMRGRMHVPIAADICSTSADLLFADEPAITIPEAHIAKATSEAKGAQNAVSEASEEDGWLAHFSEAGEIDAALGGVFMRCNWAKEVADHPLLDAVHPDAAVPEFRWGLLTAVTFWDVVEDDSKNILRHLERHEKGYILHGLYAGDRTNLGDKRPLTSHDATKDLQESIQTGIDELTAIYIPNMLPNRADRRSLLGRSDLAGAESLMDSLDEAMTSWMREIRLGKARLIVDNSFLISLGKGKGTQFDVDREIYEGLNVPPTAGTDPIHHVQFPIRVQEHLQTAENLIERIVAASGYSASTFGLASRQAASTEKTATEIRARERRSLTTRGKKIQYWRSRLAQILYVWQELDAKWFNGVAPMRPRIDFPDSVQDSQIDLANSVAILRGAGVLSMQRAVEMAHPDWDPDEVITEVNALIGEAAVKAAVTVKPTPAAGEITPANAAGQQGGSASVPAPAPPTGPQPMPPEAGGIPPPATGSATQPQ